MNHMIDNELNTGKDTEHMNRIDEKLLCEVTGGDLSGHTFYWKVELPQIDSDIKVTVYLDGELYQTETVNPYYKGSITLRFNASRGVHIVNVKIDNLPYREYEIDFDSGMIR